MTGHQRPRPPRQCLALLEQLSRYIDDEMTLKQRRAIDGHCRDCTRCRRMIAGLARTIALCRRAGATPVPASTRKKARRLISRLLHERVRASDV
jgi:anti-sigma factor RsiW